MFLTDQKRKSPLFSNKNEIQDCFISILLIVCVLSRLFFHNASSSATRDLRRTHTGYDFQLGTRMGIWEDLSSFHVIKTLLGAS